MRLFFKFKNSKCEELTDSGQHLGGKGLWWRASVESKQMGSRAMVVHFAFSPSAREAEAGESLWVLGQPGLQELASGQAPKLQRNPVLKNKTKEQKNKQTKKPFLLGWSDDSMAQWLRVSIALPEDPGSIPTGL